MWLVAKKGMSRIRSFVPCSADAISGLILFGVSFLGLLALDFGVLRLK
jgi:hypothetical protein